MVLNDLDQLVIELEKAELEVSRYENYAESAYRLCRL